MIRAESSINPSIKEEPDSEEGQAEPMQPGPRRNAQPIYGVPFGAPPDPVPGGGSITCPGCGTENLTAGSRKFCGGCGASLWESCGNCHGEVPVDERFCGHCGVNIDERNREQISLYEEHLSEARCLAKACRFSDAIGLLSTMTKVENSRLQTFAERARDLIQDLRLELDRWEKRAESAFVKAKEAWARYDDDGALQWLEEVPKPLRTSPMETLLAEVGKRRSQAESLEAELREALKGKRAAEVLSKVEMLLRLRPNHTLARQVAERVRDQYLAKAEEKMARRQYHEALNLLERIPTVAGSTRVESLRQDAHERSSLHWEMTRAPHVDPFLQEAIRRLLRLAPDDPEVRKMAAELKARWPLRADPARITPPVWAKTGKTPWDCPVEWYTTWKRIEISDQVDPRICKARLAGFAVACGLALQGIRKGPVRFDLQEAESSVLGWVSKTLREKRRDSAWGIDLGNDSLKVVRLAARDGGRRVVMTACDSVPNRKLLSRASDYGEMRDILQEGFSQILRRYALKNEMLCFAFPGRLSICRTLRLPPMNDKQVAKAVQFEARHVLPGDLANYHWTAYRPGAEDHLPPDARRDCLLLAVGRQHLAQMEETFLRLGVTPDVLQSEYLALHNLLSFELGADRDEARPASPGATVLLDMGAAGTNMIVQGPGYLWTRYLGVGGHAFTRAILREFQLTLQQAEERKRNPEQIDRWSRWESALAPVRETLGGELRSALESFAGQYPGERVERILLVGGGFQTNGLLRFLCWGR